MGSLRFKILHVGEPKHAFIQSGIEHFRKMILPYASLSMLAVKGEPHRKGLAAEQIRLREAKRIHQGMDAGYLWIALDREGERLDSDALAARIEHYLTHGRSRLAFIIGGPHGLPPCVTEKTDIVLSLSPMTFSHELTLLVLLEQIYRLLAIMHHLPYPK